MLSYLSLSCFMSFSYSYYSFSFQVPVSLLPQASTPPTTQCPTPPTTLPHSRYTGTCACNTYPSILNLDHSQSERPFPKTDTARSDQTKLMCVFFAVKLMSFSSLCWHKTKIVEVVLQSRSHTTFLVQANFKK